MHYIRVGKVPRASCSGRTSRHRAAYSLGYLAKLHMNSDDSTSCSMIRLCFCEMFNSGCYSVPTFYLQAAGRNHVWRESASPDLNHICQAKNYQLLGDQDCALVPDRSARMFPGSRIMSPGRSSSCPCPPLTSCFFIFLSSPSDLSPSSAGHVVGAALKMSHAALFFFFSPSFLFWFPALQPPFASLPRSRPPSSLPPSRL